MFVEHLTKSKGGDRLTPVKLAFARDVAQRATFDFVTAWDVVEHLSEPDRTMEGITTILKPGGWFFCSLPDISSWSARLFGETWNCLLLEHLWYFSPTTLDAYLSHFGFESVEISKLWYPADIETIVNRLAQTYGWPLMRLPEFIGRRVVNLPIGLMFGAFRRKG